MSNKNHYFSDREEEAVIKFRSEDTPQREKNRIYKEILHPAFGKMIRMLIYQRKIHYTGVDKESLISETQAHVWEQLRDSGFDPNKAKAYSYFTRTVLNYLYQKQIAKQKEIKKIGMYSIDDDENYYIETYYEDVEDFVLSDFLNWYRMWLDEHIEDYFDSEDEVIIAYAIFEIIKNDDIDINWKRDLFFSIKQLSGIDNNYKINKVLDILKETYFNTKDVYAKKRELNLDKNYD